MDSEQVALHVGRDRDGRVAVRIQQDDVVTPGAEEVVAQLHAIVLHVDEPHADLHLWNDAYPDFGAGRRLLEPPGESDARADDSVGMQNGLTVHRVRDRSGLRLFGGNVSAGNGCLDRDVGAIGIALKFEQLRRTVRGIAELRPPDDQIDRCAKPAFAGHGQPGCIGLHGDVLAADRVPRTNVVNAVRAAGFCWASASAGASSRSAHVQ